MGSSREGIIARRRTHRCLLQRFPDNRELITTKVRVLRATLELKAAIGTVGTLTDSTLDRLRLCISRWKLIAPTLLLREEGDQET